jgi:hypothetical protein
MLHSHLSHIISPKETSHAHSSDLKHKTFVLAVKTYLCIGMLQYFYSEWRHSGKLTESEGL